MLFKSARLLDEQALARLRAQSGIATLRPAHTKLLPHIDLAGTRLTDLAARLGVSKQAAGQLVNEMIDMGMLERAPHPDDGRARMVRFSARGRRGLLHGLGVLRDIETELARDIGTPDVAALRGLLARLLDALERRPSAAPPSRRELSEPGRRSRSAVVREAVLALSERKLRMEREDRERQILHTHRKKLGRQARALIREQAGS